VRKKIVIASTPANSNNRFEENPSKKLFSGSFGTNKRKTKKIIPSAAAKLKFGINNPLRSRKGLRIKFPPLDLASR
jgi:hypothetical protein